MKICVVGLGLLGGSFSLGLRALNGDYHVIGVDKDEEHARQALDLGIADELAGFEEGVSQCDVVVLATPVDELVKQARASLDIIREDAVVFDLGSTKSQICAAVAGHPRRGRFLAAHPIAGTEDSGPRAAFAELLPGKMIILCDHDLTDNSALESVVDLLQKLEMRVEHMPSAAHDMHIAYVSHLSHISSFALGATVLEKEKNENNIFIMAGSGFDSTVRLAKSSPDMWTPIFEQNRENISEAIGKYIEQLQAFKQMLDSDNGKAMHRFMKETNDIRRVLKGD